MRYEPIECLTRSNSLPSQFVLQNVAARNNYKALTIRLLTGNLNIKCVVSGEIYECRDDYSIIGTTIRTTPSIKSLRESMGVSSNKSLNGICQNVGRNSSFYRDIFYESLLFIIYQKQNRNVEAFVFAYRLLERMSMVMPLIWASTSSDYSGAFTGLKNYFSGKNTGELEFFRKYVDDIIAPSVAGVRATLNFISANPSWQSNYYDIIDAIIAENRINVISSTKPISIEIGYESMIPMMIALRNKYFHALTGVTNNIKASQIADPDEFFSIINKLAFNWLVFVIFHVITSENN